MIELLKAGVVINGRATTPIDVPDGKQKFTSHAELEAFRDKWTRDILPGVVNGLVASGIPKEEAAENKVELVFKYREI